MTTAQTTRLATELGSQNRWLKSLARALVGESEADDLVQDTVVAALRRPPTLERPIRPWLRRVLLNAARLRWRANARRSSRERAAEQPPPAKGPDDALATLQSHRLLLDAVTRLDDIYRLAIVARYVDGLSAAAIARRYEIPAATVRSRLKRALEMLRVDLNEKNDGSAPNWLAAMGPLGPSSSLPVATSGGVGWFSWVAFAAVVAMSASLVLYVAAGVPSSSPAQLADVDAGALAVAPRTDADADADEPGAASYRPMIRGSGRSQKERLALARDIETARGGTVRPRKTYDYSDINAYAEASESTVEPLSRPQRDVDYIRARIRALLPLLRECHQLRVVEAPELAGILTVAFVVDAEQDIGAYVREAELAEDSPLQDEMLAECVTETLLSLELRPLQNSGEVHIVIPLNFTITVVDGR